MLVAVVLEAAAEQPVALAARVDLDLGDAQAWQLGVPARQRLGHEVLVQDRHDRQLEAGEPGHRGGPGAGRDDDLLGAEGTRCGRDGLRLRRRRYSDPGHGGSAWRPSRPGRVLR